MAFVTTQDGVNIYFKDWGPKEAQPIVFYHGWPLSADDWDNQMLFFLAEGFRVIAIDRRGHGRSDQVSEGHDMDHYAADVSAVVEHLDLHNAVHVGHSTGGGQVAGQPQGRVAKAVLISAVPPLMVKTEQNPGGTPIEVFDGFRKALAANRAQFYLDVASGPFYGFNRDGAEISQGTIQNWWRQGMIGSAKAHYEGIKAFSETDQTEDLKSITLPVLVMQGDDDQVVPYKNAAILQDKLSKAEKASAAMAQELADLREIVFNQQRSVPQEKEEPAKIAFPYRTDRRVIAFGGHDSWLREIKFKVPDVRFMGEDISSAEVIRRADVVWIQTNCIGHNTYYNVIDLVRRYGRKVRYFKYASAVKCAEQVAEEEEKSKA